MKPTRRQSGIFGIIFICSLLILSWVGLSKLYPEGGLWRYIPDKIYKVTKIALGGDPTGSAIEPQNTPWELTVAKIFAIGIVIFGAYKIIQKAFAEQLALLSASFKRRHYITIGLSKKGQRLLSSIKKDKGEKAVVIEKDAELIKRSSVGKHGHIVVPGDGEDKETLLEAGVLHAAHLMLFLENEQSIIEIVEAIRQIYKRKKTENHLKCYVHLRHPRLIELVRNAGLYTDNKQVELHFFNQHKMVARQFYTRLLNDVYDQGIHLNTIRQVIIIGYGNFAHALLLQTLRVLHISADNDVQIALYCEQAALNEALFTEHHPKAHKIYPISFHEFTGSFSSMLTDRRLHTLDRQSIIISACDDDQTSLSRSLELLNVSSRLSFNIYTLNTEGKGLRSLIDGTRELPRLKSFGSIEETTTVESITEEKQDRMAKAIHDDYQKKISGADSESRRFISDWPALPEEAKDASRAQADHIPFKLMLTGKYLPDISKIENLSFSSADVERLAMIEHNRWMAHRYLNNWDYGEHRDDNLKHHPSLIPWQDLSEGERQKDRETILRLKKVLCS